MRTKTDIIKQVAGDRVVEATPTTAKLSDALGLPVMYDEYCGLCGELVEKRAAGDDTYFYCECCGGAIYDDEVIRRRVDFDEALPDDVRDARGFPFKEEQ